MNALNGKYLILPYFVGASALAQTSPPAPTTVNLSVVAEVTFQWTPIKDLAFGRKVSGQCVIPLAGEGVLRRCVLFLKA